MITLEKIEEAHSKIKSGEDFPNYIYDLKKLGVTYYKVYVTNGQTDYYGANNLKISSQAKYKNLIIESISNKNHFKSDLIAHQQGKTNFLTFCNDCAKSGIEKWVVSIEKMTCTYYDKKGNDILVETIPN